MRCRLSAGFFLLLITAWGCAPTIDPNTAGEVLEQEAAAAAADTIPFAENLTRHLALGDAERAAARDRALEIADQWRDFEREAHEAEDSELRHWFYRYSEPTYSHRWFGVGNSIKGLRRATDEDPSFAEGWGALGRLCAEVGDLQSALTYLDNARTAAHAMESAGQPLDPGIQLEIYRERAWVLRDLTRWNAGLGAANEGLNHRPGDPDLLLVRGLLLAGAGRYEEAVSLAVRLEPAEYPQYDFIHRGFRMQHSTFSNNWIRAMALLAIGDADMAYSKLGDLATYAYRGKIAHSPRYWRDAALLAEMAGDPQAAVYYGVGFVTRHYQQFYPAAANNVAPQVLEVPDPAMPVYTSFGHRFYIGGSPFSYIGLQLNQLSQGLFPGQRSEAAGRALQMLGLLEKRNVRPDVCRAFRGRIYFAGDDFELAREELTAARTSFAERDLVDPVTSLLLGLVDMRDGRLEPAATHLEESVVADPASGVGWRSLGVVYSQLGRRELAGQAMTKAVKLDPWNVSGLYNRGLFNFQNQQFSPAMADLDRALRIEPDNREIQRLRSMVLSAIGQTDPDRSDVTAVTEGIPEEYQDGPEELLARLHADIEGFFTVPDSLKCDAPEAEKRIGELQTVFAEHGDPMVRAVLAMALIDHGRLAEVQNLLSPGWGTDLTPEEELMLLYADHQVGELERAAQVMQQVLHSGGGGGNPYAVALAARTIRTSTDPVGTDPRNIATHGFFAWWRDARFSYAEGMSGRAQPRYDYDLFRKYFDDPMFEQAVWGMTQTPFGGRTVGPGSTSLGK